MIEKIKMLGVVLSLILIHNTTHSQQDYASFKWSKKTEKYSKFSWKSGILENTLADVSNSDIDIKFSLEGETNTLTKWNKKDNKIFSPEVESNLNEEYLQLFTRGFSTEEGISLNINFSKPVTNAFFKILDINRYYNSGDKIIIKAKTISDKTIYPTLTNTFNCSYNTFKKEGTIDAIRYTIGKSASVNVGFSNQEKIKSLSIQWKDCSTCSKKNPHGFAMSGISFNKEFIDSDSDGIEDRVDIDDDNDGILDVLESSKKVIKRNTATGNPLFTASNGVESKENIVDGINYKGARFNKVNDELVINFGKKIPANTFINLRTLPKSFRKKVMEISQSSANGSSTSNPRYIYHFGFYPRNTYYKLDEDTQYLKIKMVQNSGGAIVVDFIEHQEYTILTDIDTDGDGIPNRLDLDSDGDGCSDAVEACVPDILVNADVFSENLTNNFLKEAIIQGEFGENGFSNNLEKTDYRNTNPNFEAAYSYGINKDIQACGIPMITQVVKAPNNNWLEITNIHPTAIIPKNAIVVSLFKNANEDLSGFFPNTSIRNQSAIQPGESLLFKNDAANIPILGNLLFGNNAITNFSGDDNTITISRANNKLAWESRIDVSKNIDNKTSYVRIDEVTAPNKEFSENEWVAFIDDNLNPYRDLSIGGAERHPHAPLLSEVVTANSESNTKLGLHRINPTERINGVWSNGFPDRSRFVKIKEDFTEPSSILKARKLKITNNSTLLLNNALLVVSDSIQLENSNDQIRLANQAELIQTHKNDKQVYGLGKLLIDKQTNIKSIYRYSYLSSPVNSIGKNAYTIKDVLKDGTNPISLNSNIVDVNFVSGFNGAATNPISIADYWIYTFSSSSGSRANYEQKRSTGTIRQTSGFLIKGTGVEQNYTFVGTPKDGKLTSVIGSEDSYLLGNPYPSSISAKKFIEDNINSITGTLYFWQHAGEEDIESSNIAGHSFSGYVGGYATRNIAMGISANLVSSNDNENNNTPSTGDEVYRSPGNYIPVGTSFFVGGSKTGGQIVFNNSQREFTRNENSSIEEEQNNGLLGNLLSILPIVDFKDPDELPILKLGLDYELNEDTIHRQIGISFNENNSFALDKGYDSELFDLNETDFYWKFSEDDAKYSIVGVQEITSQLEVPLEIVMAYSGTITIGLDEKRFVDASIFLKDKETDTTYDLSERINLELESGVYSNRFYLAFNDQKNEDLPDVEEIETPEFNLSYSTDTRELKITKNEPIRIRRVALFKIFGKRMQAWRVRNQEDTITLQIRPRIKEGVYVVRVITNKGVFNKNIYIK